MSQHKLIKTISRELDSVNEIIDMKIIQGLPYKREAKRHKLLLSMLTDSQKKVSSQGVWSFSSFLF